MSNEYTHRATSRRFGTSVFGSTFGLGICIGAALILLMPSALALGGYCPEFDYGLQEGFSLQVQSVTRLSDGSQAPDAEAAQWLGSDEIRLEMGVSRSGADDAQLAFLEEDGKQRFTVVFDIERDDP